MPGFCSAPLWQALLQDPSTAQLLQLARAEGCCGVGSWAEQRPNHSLEGCPVVSKAERGSSELSSHISFQLPAGMEDLEIEAGTGCRTCHGGRGAGGSMGAGQCQEMRWHLGDSAWLSPQLPHRRVKRTGKEENP